ncbi:MAG: 3-deoxy-7-phosphoheptulonate synthase [bacterium]
MPRHPLEDVNVLSSRRLVTPDEIHTRLPVSETAAETVWSARETIKAIIDRSDPRLLIVVGPCSIHSVDAAREYAQRLRRLAAEVADTFFVVMRVYFEKPRTTVGWKGFITDPALDDSFRIDDGLRMARELLLEFAEIGLPAGTEFVDPIIPQYVADLVAWTAIGARTIESQKHRELASGLSTPVGMKNGTDGNLETALNALLSVSESHQFLGVDKNGDSAVFVTRGNPYAHIVLRGGRTPNYDSVSIRLCEEALARAGLREIVVVDASHANSRKDHAIQPMVFRDCVHQILEGNRSIIGLMLESNLHAGKQPIPKDPAQLAYGVSVTDACIDWETTEALLRESREKLRGRLGSRA